MQLNVIKTLTVRGQSQGLDKVQADLKGVSAAQERVSTTGEGMARTTDTVAKRQLSAASSFERLMERNDRMIYLQRQLEREMLVVTRAYETGHVSMERHGQAVGLVQAKYDRLIAAEAAARQQVVSTSGAIDQQTGAVNRLVVANDNLAVNSDNVRGNTANIAAQFQDIGVTAAMGMNPVMIALQQGTQLSAVLNTMQNPLRGLAAGLLSIINPVSLLTIGFVALGAVAIQWFMGAKSEADDAADALQTHDQWLTNILKGYDGASDAAKRYRDEAERLPEASVTADLMFDRKAALEEYSERLSSLRTQQEEFQRYIDERSRGASLFGNLDGAGEAVAALQTVIDKVEQAGITAGSTAAELDPLYSSLKLIATSDADAQVLHIAESLVELLSKARDSRIRVEELTAAINAMPANVQTTISLRMEGFNEAQADLNALMPDFRDRFTKLRDDANAAHSRMRSDAVDNILRLQADKDLERVLGGIDRLEAEDKARQASRGGGKLTDLQKAANSYDNLTASASQFIAAQQLSVTTLGMSTEAASRLRHEQDLLNQAAHDNIKLSPQQRSEIASLAEVMASTEERTRSLTEAYNFGQQTLGAFFSDFKRELMNGTSLWDSFASAAGKALDSIADRALSMAASGIFDMIFGAVMGGLGGGATGGSWGNGLWGSAIFNAKGNIYEGSPSLSAYSNQIVTQPTLFAFAKGAGLMGEEPGSPGEAIMPLARNSRGQLGVQVANNNQPVAANVNVQIIDQRRGGSIRQEETTGSDGEKQLRLIIQDEVRQSQRRAVPGF